MESLHSTNFSALRGEMGVPAFLNFLYSAGSKGAPVLLYFLCSAGSMGVLHACTFSYLQVVTESRTSLLSLFAGSNGVPALLYFLCSATEYLHLYNFSRSNGVLALLLYCNFLYTPGSNGVLVPALLHFLFSASYWRTFTVIISGGVKNPCTFILRSILQKVPEDLHWIPIFFSWIRVCLLSVVFITRELYKGMVDTQI